MIQILGFALPPHTLLELVHQALATDHCSQYRTFLAPSVKSAIRIKLAQITLLGLCIVAFNVLTLLYYDPLYLTEKDGATGPPQWIYFTYVFFPFGTN
jgi:ethanolaminephosphotransferase